MLVLSEGEALKELEEEDKAREVSRGARLEESRAPSAPAVIVFGISLEEEQCVSTAIWFAQILIGCGRYNLRIFVSQQKKDSPHNLEIVNERREVLRNRIESYELLRARYMLGLLHYMIKSGANLAGSSSEVTQIEDLPLWLPSEIDTRTDPRRRNNICAPGKVGHDSGSR